MKRALLVIGIVFLLLTLALAAAPFWLGMQAESAFNDAIKGLTDKGGIASKNVSFSRGWLNSEASNKILLPTAPILVEANHEIEHGPLPLSQLLSGNLAPALALISTTIQFRPTADTPANLADALKSLPPLKSETVLDLSGNGTSRLVIEGAKRTQGKMTIGWRAVSGQMQFDREWKRIKADFKLPQLNFSSADEKLTIKNVLLSSDMYEGTAGYMFGRNQISVESFTMDPLLDAKNINFSVIAQPKKQFVAISISNGIKTLKIAENNYGPGKMVLAIRNLDAKTLRQFENDMNKINSRTLPKEQAQMMIAGKTLELAGKLSRHNPEIEVTKLNFDSPGGALTGKAKFVVQGKEQDLSANPMLLLTAIEGSAEVSIPESLAKAIVMPQIQRDIRNLKKEGKLSKSDSATLTAEALNKIAEEAYPQYLQESGIGRWLIKQEDMYRFSMSVSRGKIMINGVALQPGK